MPGTTKGEATPETALIRKKEKGSMRCAVCAAMKLNTERICYCKTSTTHPSLHPDSCSKVYHTLKISKFVFY
jgi:hypothetical protein